MKLIADLKNLFLKSSKEKKIDFNRQRAEDQQIKALSLGKKPHAYGGFRARNLQAIYVPQRGKFKGWMRERKRSTFNSTK